MAVRFFWQPARCLLHLENKNTINCGGFCTYHSSPELEQNMPTTLLNLVPISSSQLLCQVFQDYFVYSGS